MMNSSALVKKTILCKRCIILWLTVLFEIFIVLKYKNFAVDLHFNNIYESMLLLFKFSVIIIQYLFFISIYMENYQKDYLLLRCGNIKTLRKVLLIDVLKLTLFFICIFNVEIIFLIKIMFNSILSYEVIKYLFITVIFQFLSFLLLGYLCVVIFLKTYKVFKMTIITIVLYFIAIFILQDLFSYFVLEAGIKSDKVINMFRNIGSLYIIAAIHYIHSNSKVVDIYERD